MTTPARRDIAVYRGDDYSHTVTFLDEDGVTPLSVAGLTFIAQVRNKEDADAFVSFDVDDTDAATGVIVLTLSSASSKRLGKRRCVWDLQATDADGLVTTYLYGAVLAQKDVSR